MWALIRETFSEWIEDRAPRLGAALAYYMIFSLAPILMIVIAIAGLFFGRETVQSQLMDQITGLIGPQGAEAVGAMLDSASRDRTTGAVAAVIGAVVLVFGASGVFVELQDALNTIWDVKPKPGRGLWGIIRDRFMSFAMVLGIGFLLLVSLVLSAAVAAAGTMLGPVVPEALLHTVNLVLSFVVSTLLFAMIYKVLPDVDVLWSDVWLGAAVTSLLFSVGKFAIGLYLGKSGLTSAYGAAGSLVAVLVWVYYSAQILYLGAEFTQVYARRRGHGWAATERAELKPSAAAPATVVDSVEAAGPALTSWVMAAAGACAGFVVARTPLPRVLAKAPDAVTTAAQVTGAVVALDELRRQRRSRRAA